MKLKITSGLFFLLNCLFIVGILYLIISNFYIVITSELMAISVILMIMMNHVISGLIGFKSEMILGIFQSMLNFVFCVVLGAMSFSLIRDGLLTKIFNTSNTTINLPFTGYLIIFSYILVLITNVIVCKNIYKGSQ